jgi:hypothetical protein
MNYIPITGNVIIGNNLYDTDEINILEMFGTKLCPTENIKICIPKSIQLHNAPEPLIVFPIFLFPDNFRFKQFEFSGDLNII